MISYLSQNLLYAIHFFLLVADTPVVCPVQRTGNSKPGHHRGDHVVRQISAHTFTRSSFQNAVDRANL